MNKELLIALIKQHTGMLKDVMEMMELLKDKTETELYQSLYALGNDISQELDRLKYELKYA